MSGVTSMNQVIIRKLTEIIRTNLDKENYGVNELALAAGMSRSAIHRKLKKLLNKSSSQFIREERLQAAMEMLQQDVATASEISYKVGFNSPTYFNTCFHQYFGYPPGEVKKRILSGPQITTGNDLLETEDTMPESSDLNADPIHYVRFRRRKIVMAFAIAVALFCAIIYWHIILVKNNRILYFKGLKAFDKSIVVLPFKILNTKEDNQYFAEGVTEDILNNLSRIRGLRVISRVTGEHYRGGTVVAPRIAKELGANFILEGSVQQNDGKVRIIVQLIDAVHDQHIWSEKYDSELSDIFIIQSNIARQIAVELQTVLSSREVETIGKIPTKNPEAYNFYLKGRFFWNSMNEEGVKKSIEYFEMALAADPKYALAYSGLADAYYIQAWWGWSSWTDGCRNARVCIQRALELDQKLAEAHATLGALLFSCDWNWAGAQKEFLHAIELNPNVITAHQYYSEFLDLIGKNVDARKQINLAFKLDPFSPTLYFLNSRYYYHEGRLEESLANCSKVGELMPDSKLANWRCFLIYYRKGDGLRAFESLQKILATEPSTIKSATLVKNVYIKSNLKGLIKWLIVMELEKADSDFILLARLNAMIGKKQETLRWLGKALAVRSHGLSLVLNDPDFKILHNEPQFREIINRMGLSEYNNNRIKLHR